MTFSLENTALQQVKAFDFNLREPGEFEASKSGLSWKDSSLWVQGWRVLGIAGACAHFMGEWLSRVSREAGGTNPVSFSREPAWGNSRRQ